VGEKSPRTRNGMLSSVHCTKDHTSRNPSCTHIEPVTPQALMNGFWISRIITYSSIRDDWARNAQVTKRKFYSYKLPIIHFSFLIAHAIVIHRLIHSSIQEIQASSKHKCYEISRWSIDRLLAVWEKPWTPSLRNAKISACFSVWHVKKNGKKRNIKKADVARPGDKICSASHHGRSRRFGRR